MARTISLPNGRKIPVKMYAVIWRNLMTMPADRQINGWHDFGAVPAPHIVAEMRQGMHERINRHDPAYGMGRKWSGDWQNKKAQERKNCL